MSKTKRVLYWTLCLTTSSLLTLLAVEGVFRFFSPSFSMNNLLQPDSELGYTLIPNTHTNYYWRGSFSTISTNEMGMRQKDPISEIKRPDEFRVLVLGDSMTFGWGVNLEDSFFNLIKEKTENDFPNQKFLFLNGGFGGYGTQENLRFFERNAKRLQPDLVLLFMGPNDVRDNQRSTLYRLENDQLIKNPHTTQSQVLTASPLYHWVLFNSVFFQFIRAPLLKIYQTAQVRYQQSKKTSNPQISKSLKPATKTHRFHASHLMTQKLLLALKENALNYGAGLIVSTTGPMERPNERFFESSEDWFKSNHIDLVDISKEMRKELNLKQLKSTWYFADDTHFTPEGGQAFVKYTWPKLKPLLAKRLKTSLKISMRTP